MTENTERDALIAMLASLPLDANPGPTYVRLPRADVRRLRDFLTEREPVVVDDAIREALRIDTHYMHPAARAILRAALTPEGQE